jgi:hypothetical protein
MTRDFNWKAFSAEQLATVRWVIDECKGRVTIERKSTA